MVRNNQNTKTTTNIGIFANTHKGDNMTKEPSPAEYATQGLSLLLMAAAAVLDTWAAQLEEYHANTRDTND